MKQLSIRDKLVLYSTGIIFLVAITLTSVSYLNDRRAALKAYEQEAYKVAEMVQEAIEYKLGTNNLAGVEQNLNYLKVNTDIYNGYVIDKSGHIIAALRSVGDERNQVLKAPYINDILNSTTLSTHVSDQFMVIGGPLEYNGQSVGYIYIQFSLTKLHQKLKDHLYLNLLMLVLCLIVGMILARILSDNFTRPIFELINLTHKISEGKETIEFPKQGAEEFGVLGKSLQEMLNNLRQIHKKLEDATVELDNKVKERTKALEIATQKAEDANKEKSRFLANVSHEIRTPMSGIIGAANLIKNTPLNQEQRKYVGIMELSAESLLTLINDILDLSKIESGKLEVEKTPFNLRQTVDDVMDLLAYRTREKDLSFGYFIDEDIPEEIVGDPTRIKQILINLVGNGIKFTEKGSITIRIAQQQESEDSRKIRFAVTDTGIGIPEEKQDKLFKAFSQVDASTTRHFGGTGLGLAISKKLCQLMGGDLNVTSQAGKGSTFYFILNVPKAPNEKLRSYDSQLQSKNVFIIDNNPIRTEFLESFTKRLQMVPTITPKSDLAVSALKTAPTTGKKWDLFIIHEPLLSKSLLETLLSYHEKEHCAVIVLSDKSPLPEIQSPINKMRAEYIGPPLKEQAVYHAFLRAFDLEAPLEVNAAQVSDEIIPVEKANEIHILVVDDNMISQQISVKLLEKLGFQVHAASSGKEAIEAMDLVPFNMVFMDCQMPEMDGFETTRRLRQNPKWHDIPIVALTANAMKSDEEACLEAGMTDFVTKPVKTPRLTEVIQRYLSQILSS